MGIDPSTVDTGVVVINPKTLEIVSIRSYCPIGVKDILERVRYIALKLYNDDELFKGVGIVMIEKPASKLNFKTLYALSALSGAILMVLWLKRTKAKINFVAVSTAKKRISGNGRASKAEVITAVKEKFGMTLRNDNIADAIAVAMCGVVE